MLTVAGISGGSEETAGREALGPTVWAGGLGLPKAAGQASEAMGHFGDRGSCWALATHGSVLPLAPAHARARLPRCADPSGGHNWL